MNISNSHFKEFMRARAREREKDSDSDSDSDLFIAYIKRIIQQGLDLRIHILFLQSALKNKKN